ncbi:ABC transporter permease [Neobacillus thermocopriae]|uniref:ABC transporter permease subunit n=1 Tax=Neobacillus thermocopriae TaxID=1215031 RepID=A0A6B3TQ23_9BACI|nr:ABC transporter permease subunit [Neobacillus thermocopriae]MED3624447.1 ABC transporter permease subunit [Neobacillus thermocopriae]MED3714838.1 ABC transporter permease subunit [Neobacillus thermocopriae]NEX78722.1 ABC transporter permease subunit [Neobacillus thermocopriae]
MQSNQLQKSNYLKVKIISLSTVFVLVIVWALVTNLEWIDPYFIPKPQDVWAAFIELTVDGYKGISLFAHISSSLYRLFIALLLAFISAIPLGLLCGYSKIIRAIFDPIIEFYRPLPPLAYYAVLVLWLGIENESKIALLFLSAFAPLFISTAASVQKVPVDRINASLALGATKWKLFRYIILPSCQPDILTGLRTSIGITYATLVAAEMVAATSGIGWMVLDASKYLRSDIVFAGIILMGIIAIVLDSLLRLYQARRFSWVGK